MRVSLGSRTVSDLALRSAVSGCACAKNERSKDASTLAWALLVLIADLAIALFDQFGRRAEVLEVIVE